MSRPGKKERCIPTTGCRVIRCLTLSFVRMPCNHRQPTAQPTEQPTEQPTHQPTTHPTMQPSRQPTRCLHSSRLPLIGHHITSHLILLDVIELIEMLLTMAR